MLRWWPHGLLVVICLSTAACAKTTTTQVSTGVSEETDLSKPIEVSVASLLEKPRQELAATDHEFVDRVVFQKKVLRERPVETILLDKMRYPLEIPIWQESRFSESDNLSLPPYITAGKKDNALAWHLARFGDLESAKKLADESHLPALVELHQAHYERNYPVEWSRLIARIQHLGHLRLVTGELDGATLLMELHKQLTQTLDSKARKSPLGAVLLRQGRLTLREAETAWRTSKKTVLADQVKKNLAEWGEIPASGYAHWIGATRAELSQTLGLPVSEGGLSLEDTRRAVDLLDLPLAHEQIEGISFTFDADNKVREIVVCYQPQVGRVFSSPEHLATALEEQGVAGKDSPTVADVRRRQYSGGGVTCDVLVLLTNAHVGALALLRADKPATSTATLKRDFDLVHLDASFDFNRLQLNPQMLGDKIESKNKDILADLDHPFAAMNPLVTAGIEREPGAQTTDRVLFVGDKRRVPLHKLVGTLWQEAGPGTWTAIEDTDGGQFTLVWEDKATSYTLRLPNVTTIPARVEAADRSSGKDQASRDVAALKFDGTRRQQRIENNDPWDPLPRSLQLHQFKLGDTRAAVEKALPGAEKTSFGLRYIFPEKVAAIDPTLTTQKTSKTPVKKTPGKPAPPKAKTPAPKVEEPEYSPRQLLLRFDDKNRLAEIRLFVQENTTKNGSMVSKYQALFGVNPPIESAWAALWKDLPPLKPTPLMCQWQDDLTFFSCQRSGFGTEMILRDCPLEHPNGAPLPAFVYLARGPAEAKLDQTRSEVLAAWKGRTPKPVADDPLILEPGKAGLYDAYFLWFDGDKVIRIVARHAAPASPKVTFPERSKAILLAWGALMKEVGFWSRCDMAGDKSGQYVKSYGWSDDNTRVRLYWQDEPTGPRLFTEWRALKSDK